MKKFLLLFLVAGLCTNCEKMLLGPEPENNAGDIFEVLWKTLDEKYALFPVKNVNWDSLYTVYNTRISPETSESELWEICGELIAHLNDGHVTVYNRGSSQWKDSRSLDHEQMLGFSIQLIKNKFLSGVKTTAEGYITYGRITGTNYGYIYVSTFRDAPSGRDWLHDFDMVFRELYDTDAMIIDLRNNGGGLAVNDLYFSSFFVEHEFIYYYTQTKSGPGHDDFNGPKAWSIAPREDDLTYEKRNVLLTNRFSGSGSEVVALIFNQLPNSVQIGDTTNGSFGASLHVALLPNGWTLYYPSTLTTTPDGRSPEGIGIIPDVSIQNTKADIDAGIDRVFDQAVQYLSGN